MSTTSSTATEVLWQAQQDAARAEARVESRAAWKRFAVALGLIALTVSVAALFARR